MAKRDDKPAENLEMAMSNDAHLGTPSIYLTEFTKKKSADRRGSLARRAAHFVAIGVTAAIVALALLLTSFGYVGFRTMTELRAQVDQTYNPSFRVRFDDIGEQTIRSWYGDLPAPVNISSNVKWPDDTDQTDQIEALAPQPSDGGGEGGTAEPADPAEPGPEPEVPEDKRPDQTDPDAGLEENGSGADDSTANTDGEATTTTTSNEGMSVNGLAFLGGEQIELTDNSENYASQQTVFDEDGKEIKPDESNPAYAETLTYYAIVNGWPSKITVTLGIPGLSTENTGNIPTLLEAPSIETVPQFKDSKMLSSPNNSTVESASTEVKEAAGNWAQAYVTDDRDTLASLVRDPSAEAVFIGLNGTWQWPDDGAVEVGNAYSFVAEDGNTYMAATVTFDAQMEISPAEEATADTQAKDAEYATTTTSMDILVQDFSGSIPQIVAWGPAGSGSLLSAYDNRVKEKEAPDHVTRPDEKGTTTGTG